jgi:transposase-like protein
MTTHDIYSMFPQHADCIDYLERLRWQGKPICPYCNHGFTTPLKTERRHHCNVCNVPFSVMVGTLFQHTRLPLQKWFVAIHLVAEKMPAMELARSLGVNKNTACRVIREIKRAWLEPTQRTLLREIINLHN